MQEETEIPFQEETEMQEEYNSIVCLPNEILSIILRYSDCQDILSFGSTCKRFWEVVQNNEILWKEKFKALIPPIMFESVETHSEGNWLDICKGFHNLRKQIFVEIIAMSPKFYWQCYEVTLEDIRHFFTIALSDNFNYFYVIFILQDMIKKGNTLLDNNHVKKPYTLTDMYYAKIVLRHLIQTLLAVKWVKLHMKNELLPELVVNFFLQWIDNSDLHSDSEVENRIDELVKKVETVLNAHAPKSATLPVKERCANNLVSEKQILNAVTQVIYQQRHMAVTGAANLETLDINKVLTTRCGNIIAVGAIYHAVARRCGVRCELVAFPNHLFLEWNDRSDPRRPLLYTIDIATGTLKPKRRCPFSQVNQNTNYKYCPDSLLQYIYSSFHMSMGAIKNWNTQNAFHLLDFLGTSHSPLNPYRNFLPYLIDHTHLPAMSTTLDVTYLQDAHIQIIRSLANLNVPAKPATKHFDVKRRASVVRFAVGMICYHKKFDYVGIIRGWDIRCDVKWADRLEMELTLEFGMGQPFYYIMAVDQSNRYVAQENLIDITRPTRLYHLEDAIAREFTHYDGFSYVLNNEKKSEYPDEEAVTNVYRIRSNGRRES